MGHRIRLDMGVARCALCRLTQRLAYHHRPREQPPLQAVACRDRKRRPEDTGRPLEALVQDRRRGGLHARRWPPRVRRRVAPTGAGRASGDRAASRAAPIHRVRSRGPQNLGEARGESGLTGAEMTTAVAASRDHALACDGIPAGQQNLHFIRVNRLAGLIDQPAHPATRPAHSRRCLCRSIAGGVARRRGRRLPARQQEQTRRRGVDQMFPILRGELQSGMGRDTELGDIEPHHRRSSAAGASTGRQIAKPLARESGHLVVGEFLQVGLGPTNVRDADHAAIVGRHVRLSWSLVRGVCTPALPTTATSNRHLTRHSPKHSQEDLQEHSQKIPSNPKKSHLLPSGPARTLPNTPAYSRLLPFTPSHGTLIFVAFTLITRSPWIYLDLPTHLQLPPAAGAAYNLTGLRRPIPILQARR